MLIKLHSQAMTMPKVREAIQASDEIEHRLTPPKSSQTIAMIERFDGRIKEVLQAITSDPVKSWRSRCTDASGSTTNNFRVQH